MANPKNTKQVNLPYDLWARVSRRVAEMNSTAPDPEKPMTIVAYVSTAVEQRLDREGAVSADGNNPVEG